MPNTIVSKVVADHNSKCYAIYKDVHIVVPFAYLSSLYSKFEWAENAAVQVSAKKAER